MHNIHYIHYIYIYDITISIHCNYYIVTDLNIITNQSQSPPPSWPQECINNA